MFFTNALDAPRPGNTLQCVKHGVSEQEDQPGQKLDIKMNAKSF